MHAFRSFVALTVAIVSLAICGMAAAAQPQKQWSITVSPATFATTTNVPVSITIKNETPNGNSTINSLRLVLPSGYTVNSVGNIGWPATLDLSQPGVIALSNMSPLKPQASFTMTATLNVSTGTGGAGCTATDWSNSRAWTGSSFSGDTFQLIFSTSTGVDPNNALAFQDVVTSVPVGTDSTGSVKATACGGVKSGVNVSVKMTNSSNVVVAGPTTYPTDANGIASWDFPTTTAGTYTITASAAGFPAITTTVVVCGNGLTFSPAPANVQTGTPISTSVLANSCNNVAAGVSITAQATDSSGNPVGSSQTVATNASGLAAFQFPIAALGTYTITASATNYSSISAKATVFAGILNCGQPIAANFINPQNLAPDQPGYAAGSRNRYNKDGVSEECVPVLYTFTNNILNPNASIGDTVNLTWDTTSQPNAVFEYTMNWQTQPVEAGSGLSGWPLTMRPSVAWLNQDGSETTGLSDNPAFVPALACASNSLPAPYGTLTSAIGTSETSITVTGIAANAPVNNPLTNTPYTQPAPGAPAIPAVPFPIVIANSVSGTQSTATERMLVTAAGTPMQNGDGTYTITFTVTRGDAMTTPAPHGATYRVMSTPLPLIPSDDPGNFPAAGIYKPGTQAHMCVASHGFSAFSFEGGTPHVVYKTHVFDIGDGWVRGF
jgi:hypothetical protein